MSSAFPIPTTNAALPRRAQILHVAMSRGCDRETCELGEDYAEMRKVEAAYRLLMARLSRARRACNSDEARGSIKEMLVLLPDARHDATWGGTLALAKDAAVEASVMRMVRS